MNRQRFAAIGFLWISGLLAGCTERDAARMVSVSPPPGWEAQLLQHRAIRDEAFRTSPDTPLLQEDRGSFEGLTYWPPDNHYYFLGPVNFYDNPERFQIVATSGKQRPCERVGWISIVVNGTHQHLQVYRMLDVEATSETDGFFLPFMDTTTGKDTYPAGRYIELEGPDGGPYVLDFNRAYNPSCAYGDPERFACPVTPPENRLTVSIEAGERGFRERGEET
jgi:uncharacterized protein (DUF1684 family)